MTAPRLFSLGAILSIADGRLVAPNGMDDVYEILNFMTGDNLSTIGLLSAAPPCKRALLEQHPQLADASPGLDGVNPENLSALMVPLVGRFGHQLPVTPLASWEKRSVVDDVLDAIRINPKAEIMVVDP